MARYRGINRGIGGVSTKVAFSLLSNSSDKVGSSKVRFTEEKDLSRVKRRNLLELTRQALDRAMKNLNSLCRRLGAEM